MVEIHQINVIAIPRKHDSESILVISRAARICRQDLFVSKTMFQGTFPKGCSTDASAKSLLILLDMILRGPDIKGELKDDTRSQIIHGIVQLIKYNSVNYSQANATRRRHNIERETALPILGWWYILCLEIRNYTTLVCASHMIAYCRYTRI